MVAGRWHSIDAIDGRRAQVAGRLANSHRRVDHYEQLLAAKRYDELVRFLKKLKPRDVEFNANVVIDNADWVAGDKHGKEAMLLLTEFTRLLPDEFAVWNALGRLQAENGEKGLARTSYMRSLACKPFNGTALNALAKL